MRGLFAGTLFVSAGLLFLVQPMVAKMILPLLGGSPAVWTSCMVFFQAALLAAYLYAHQVTSRLPLTGQLGLHLVVLALPLLVLPIGLSAELANWVAGYPSPVLAVLGFLSLTVGLPFFAVATSAPLLQKWFSQSATGPSADPYSLYAASNLGSMLALLGYPLLLEPAYTVNEQSDWWRVGYVLFIVLSGACGFVAWRRSAALPSTATTAPASGEAASEPPPTAVRRLRWIALAFVPSSLMLGVTTYITADIAAVPLLWIVPLALYLLSFIIVFAQWQPIDIGWASRILPILSLGVVVLMINRATLPAEALIGLHWLVLFVVAIVCHGELARDRPSPRHLTEFYLWMSVGGVLGGLANAVVAPLLFRTEIFEYPLVLWLACLLRPGVAPSAEARAKREWVLTAVFAVLSLALLIALPRLDPDFHNLEAGFRNRMVVLGLAALACFTLADRPLRFGVGLAVLWLVFTATLDRGRPKLFVDRNFFGIVCVQDDPEQRFRQLIHGNTPHGIQRLQPDGQPVRDCEPLAYYFRTGPVGQIFDVFNRRTGEQRVAIAGLGIGGLSAYAQPNQHWTYYEIDPTVETVARDVRFFTYLADCKAAEVNVVLGDARLRLQETPDQSLDLFVLDVFSSDAVPVHLLSKEALDLYLAKLKPDGFLAFNISNRYLDLRAVLANLAADCATPLVGFCREEVHLEPEEKRAGKKESRWVVLARRREDLGNLPADPHWAPLQSKPGARVWTDRYSNFWEVLLR